MLLKTIGYEMQQQLSEGHMLVGKDCGMALLQLPFRCPRCGERQRLRGLSSLRAHWGAGHTYHTMHSVSPVSRWEAGETAVGAGCTERCRSSIGAGPLEVLPSSSGLKDSGAAEKLHRVSTDLARMNEELLQAHARSRTLAQERQQVWDRERALCQQVDTAVQEIGRLREQITHSQKELQKKELEVISIHNFLEVAAQREMCGKVKLQHFIENLLRRIALAERLLECYQNISSQNCRKHVMFPADIRAQKMIQSRAPACHDLPNPASATPLGPTPRPYKIRQGSRLNRSHSNRT